MDIYQSNTRWKIVLTIAVLIILALSLVYTDKLADKLAESERYRVELWAQSIMNTAAKATMTFSDDIPVNDRGVPVILADKLDDTERQTIELWVENTLEKGRVEDNLNFASDILFDNKEIPAILTDAGDIIEGSINLDSSRENDTLYLKHQLAIMKKAHPPIVVEPYPGIKQKIYYKNTRLLTLLTYFPYFQAILIVVFFGVGYWAFSQARSAEQNRVWVGLAKETAHQLGTPLSSLVAWLEYLKMSTEEDEEVQSILVEFRKDLGRLELVAERFSKIGSIPSLEAHDLHQQLSKNFNYMKRRAAKKVQFILPEKPLEPVLVNINPPLFDWVIENLVKNALDAMGQEGAISAEFKEDKQYIYIDVSDTGKGIPPSKLKTIFEPGFTTKKRGWGLGLSLTKRIVENYHSGKIFVKESIVNKGTTFRITLPKQ